MTLTQGTMQAGIEVRPARPADAGLILALVRELAVYEKLADRAVATEADLAAALFGPAPRVFCDIVDQDETAAGFALWFYNFSTFRGQHGITLEDLFVRPAFRGAGLGKALLGHLARRCLAERLGRLEWSVLDWNAPAIAFYEAQGAVRLDDWTTCRVEGAAMARLAAGE